MDRINNIKEGGGAGDWGTDKARAKLQKANQVEIRKTFYLLLNY